MSNVPIVGIVVDPFLLEYMAEHTAYCTVVLKDADDLERARRGLETARAALAAARHREGDDPVVTWTSGVASTPGGLQFSFDAADAEGEASLVEHLLGVIVGALSAAGPRVGLLTHPPSPFRALETATAATPADDLDARGEPAGWPLDIPLPEPRQEIYGSSAVDACSRAFMVPHPAEVLMSFFEDALPRQGYSIIISVDLNQPHTTYVGRVFFRQGELTGQVAVTHAGSARHVEIMLRTGHGDVRDILANLGAQEHLPPGMRLRVDNRHSA